MEEKALLIIINYFILPYHQLMACIGLMSAKYALKNRSLPF